MLCNEKSWDFSIFKIAFKIRNKLQNIFIQNGLKDNELGVASALILGKKDELDKEIVEVLGKRRSLVLQIAEYKKINKLDVKDSEREKDVISKKIELAKELGLDPDLIEDIFKRIFEYSRELDL